jgi:hypothetical protein
MDTNMSTEEESSVIATKSGGAPSDPSPMADTSSISAMNKQWLETKEQKKARRAKKKEERKTLKTLKAAIASGKNPVAVNSGSQSTGSAPVRPVVPAPPPGGYTLKELEEDHTHPNSGLACKTQKEAEFSLRLMDLFLCGFVHHMEMNPEKPNLLHCAGHLISDGEILDSQPMRQRKPTRHRNPTLSQIQSADRQASDLSLDIPFQWP